MTHIKNYIIKNDIIKNVTESMNTSSKLLIFVNFLNRIILVFKVNQNQVENFFRIIMEI